MGSAESNTDDAERTAELVRARDEAIAAGQARADFLARMSHEIRTPMNAVIGMAELLLMERLEPQVADGIRTIRSAADALLALINDILDFSKIDAGGLSLQPVDFDLGAQLSSIIELMAAPARKAGIELRVLIDPRTAGTMYGDEARLRQILINLVGNAVKFTEAGFVELRARVASERGRDVCIEFCVADSGPGIARDAQESIFEVFEQGDGSSTRRHGGTGLGLAISRRLVEMFGGRLWVDSELGQGARFHFTAWLKRAEAKEPAPRRITAVPVARVEGSILLVDDNPANRAITARLLEKVGYAVQTAHDGREALSAFTSGAFDLVLMDVQMPGLDGIGATERIRGWESTRGMHVPIVGLSAVTAPEAIERCRRAGMDDFLTKPIRAAALFEMVERALGSAKAREAANRPTIAQQLGAQAVVDAFGDDRESAQLCLEVFLASRPEYTASLQAGIDRNDAEALHKVGHTLAGSFMGIIRPELLEHARTLEDEPTPEHAETMLRVLETLDREVRAYLESPEARLAI